jgi:UPF0755 protein
MKHRAGCFSFSVLILVAAAVVAGMYLYQGAQTPFKGYDAAEAFVEMPPGSSPQAIGSRLAAAGVVRDRLSFRIALWETGEARRLKAGEYRFDRAMTPREVVEKLEGLTIKDMAVIYEERGLGRAADFLAAARDASRVRDLDPGAHDLEGYLYPETYRLARRARATDLVDMMVKRFRQVFAPIESGVQAHGLTPRRAVTLASLVEKETGSPEERPIVAAVYLNRLKIGMGLQCDPTVIYALARVGRYTGSLTHADLSFDSPYNTYRYGGLPPGPIASPGRTSLEAVAAPAGVDFLYFVSRNDGTHEFARDLATHNRNVQKYQVQYFKDKRRQDARGRAPAPHHH